MNPLFVFAVDTTLPRGDSTHVLEFVHHISRQCPASAVFTYNDVKVSSRYLRLLLFRIRLWLRYLVERRQKVYLRYFPAIFVDMLLLRLLGREVYVELNAVISDEAQDLGRPLWLRLIHKIDEKTICAFSKALVAVTPEIRRYYVEEYGKRETVLVNNGVNTELFDPARAGFPTDMPDLRGRFVVGFVGSLSPWQDFATLIDAMDALVRRRGLDDIRCLIIGSGAEEGFIRQRIADLGLEEHIIMAGRRNYEEIPDYINLFSVAVAPLKGSRNKNTGSAALKVFEYLSMAKPLVLSEVGSLSEMIRAKGVGLVYRSSDHADLADTIFQIYSGSADTVSMTARSRELVETEYSWAAAVRDTMKIIRGDKITCP
jgi:glycosyltransferase involved in cell wall biosynthesis